MWFFVKASWTIALLCSFVACFANGDDSLAEGSSIPTSGKTTEPKEAQAARAGKQLPFPFAHSPYASPYRYSAPYFNPYARQGLETPYPYQQLLQQPSSYDYQQLAYLRAVLAASANPYFSLGGASYGGLPVSGAYSPPPAVQQQPATQTFVLIPENEEEFSFLSQLSQAGGGYVVTPSGNSGQEKVSPNVQGRNKFLSTMSTAPSDAQGRFFVNNWNQLLPTFTFDTNTNSFTYSKPNIVSQVYPISARVASFSDGADVGGTAATVTGQAFFFQEAFNKEIYTAITFVGVDSTAGLRYNVEVYSSNDVGTPNCAATGALQTLGSLTGVIATNIPAPAGAPGVLSIVQRTPISAMTLHGTFAAIGRSIVLREVTTGATGVRVACGAVTFL